MRIITSARMNSSLSIFVYVLCTYVCTYVCMFVVCVCCSTLSVSISTLTYSLSHSLLMCVYVYLLEEGLDYVALRCTRWSPRGCAVFGGARQRGCEREGHGKRCIRRNIFRETDKDEATHTKMRILTSARINSSLSIFVCTFVCIRLYIYI
jgi:hypothetical protein